MQALLTPRTGGVIIAVHLYGLAAEMGTLTELAAQRGLPLVEDNAQSLGAIYKNKKVGFGTVSATSLSQQESWRLWRRGG